MIENKDEILQSYEDIINNLTDTSGLDRESTKLQSEREVVADLLLKCVEENAHSTLDQEEYQRRYKDLVKRYEAAENGLNNVNDKRLEKKTKRESIGAYIRTLKQSDILLTEFDEEFWNAVIDRVTVNVDGGVTFVFRDGTKLDWGI
jgi:FKBP-type peptidyl-prolyl cis-trans isomerase (trigger factor)